MFEKPSGRWNQHTVWIKNAGVLPDGSGLIMVVEKLATSTKTRRGED